MIVDIECLFNPIISAGSTDADDSMVFRGKRTPFFDAAREYSANICGEATREPFSSHTSRLSQLLPYRASAVVF
jgi:hypothetical protein